MPWMVLDLSLRLVCWLVGCFGFYGPLRQYFSPYRVVSQREGERRERIDESRNVQTTPTRTYCKRNRPLPYCNHNWRTPRHWKFTQHHRTTRPPPFIKVRSITSCYSLAVKYWKIRSLCTEHLSCRVCSACVLLLLILLRTNFSLKGIIG